MLIVSLVLDSLPIAHLVAWTYALRHVLQVVCCDGQIVQYQSHTVMLINFAPQILRSNANDWMSGAEQGNIASSKCEAMKRSCDTIKKKSLELSN